MTRNKIKLLTWINESHVAFERLKALVNVCPKLYLIDYSLRIILYTDASDYAHGAPLPTSIKRRFRRRTNSFPGGTFHGPQTRWSTIEKEAYAIYWTLLRLDDLVGGVHFMIRTDHRNLISSSLSNTLLFGNAFSTDPSLLTQIHRDVSDVHPQSIRDFNDTFIERQSKIIDAAIQSQKSLKTSNLRKRYQTYSRAQDFASMSKQTRKISRVPLTQYPLLTL